MAAPVLADAISFNEEQVTSIPTLSVQSTNLMENFDASLYPPSIQIIIEGLKHSVLFNAFTIFKSMPLRLVSLAFSTSIYQKNKEAVQSEVDGGKKFSIRKSSFIRLLGLSVEGIFVTPTAEEMVAMFNQMGYSPPLTKISQFKKSKRPVIWNVFFTFFKRCLTGRKGGQDSASQLFLQCLYSVYFNEQVDYGSIIWHEFVESLKISTKDVELSCHRFWSVILDSAYREKSIPYNAAEEPQLVSLSLSIPSKLYEQGDLTVVGHIPEEMLNRMPATSTILLDYRSPVIKPIPLIQDSSVPKAKRSKKRKEHITTESQIKPTKQLKIGEEEMEESSQRSSLKRLLKKPKSHTPKFQTLIKSKKRRQILTDDQDDDILPISQVLSIAPLTNIIDPTAEEQEVVIVNKENTDSEVQHMEDETEIDEPMLVSTEAVIEEVMGGKNARIDTETVGNEVAKEVVVTTVRDVLTTNVSAEVVNETVVTEVVTTEVSAVVVNQTVVTEVVTTEVSAVIENFEIGSDQRTVDIANQDEIVEQEVVTVVSGAIQFTESESSIFDDLQNLNVSIPTNSPIVPPIVSVAPVLENLVDETYIALSKDEEFELAPITDDDDNANDDTNDDQFISMKQYKILNHKLKMHIRFQDLPKEKILQKETEIESVVLNFYEKLETQSTLIQKLVDEFDDFKKIMNTDVGKLKEVCEEMKTSIQQLDNTEVKDECADIKDKIQNLEVQNVQGDEQFKSLREDILHLQGLYENEVKKKLDEAMNREEKLQRIVDDSLAHIKVLEESIKTYDEKAIAEEYNEKVVKNVEMVQQNFIARLSPLINFVKLIPKTKEGTSEVTVPKPFRKMDLPLFKSTAETSLPYFNPTTTAEPQAIVQQLSYPVVTQQQPEAAIRALDAARRLSKGIVIGSSIPLMTTSTIVSPIGEGSSIASSGKGKQAVVELSKEERKMKEAGEIEKMKQKISLIRQGERKEILGMIGETKIWSEETIRNIAFGEGEFFNMSLKESYNVDLSHNQQLDLPVLPILFTVKCFIVKPSIRLLTPTYEEHLIRFYGGVGKLENEVWSLNPIIQVKQLVPCEVFEGVFQNMKFTVLRTNNKVYTFTLADLPKMNPSDLIKLYKMFTVVEKIDLIHIITHLRRLLRAYVEAFAKKDMIVSKEFSVRLRKPNISQSGISKEKMEK